MLASSHRSRAGLTFPSGFQQLLLGLPHALLLIVNDLLLPATACRRVLVVNTGRYLEDTAADTTAHAMAKRITQHANTSAALAISTVHRLALCRGYTHKQTKEKRHTIRMVALEAPRSAELAVE